MRHVARPFQRGQQHDGGAIRDQAAIEQVQRVDNHAGGLVLLDGERRLHHGIGTEQRVLAQGDRHGGELLGAGAIQRHVALHGQGCTDGGRGEAVDRVLAMGCPLLAHALGVAGSAEDAELAGEADGGDAGDGGGHAGGHGHGSVLQCAGDEASMGPALVHVVDLQPIHLRHAVTVGAQRPAHVERQAVNVGAVELGIGQRGPQRLGAESDLAGGQKAAEGALSDPDDGHVMVQGVLL